MTGSFGERIEKRVIDNLIDAHSRFVPSYSVIGYILLTRFILRLAKLYKNVLAELVPEDNQ